MKATYDVKPEEKKKHPGVQNISHPETRRPREQELGAPAGIPLFMQGSFISSAGPGLIQRQLVGAEELIQTKLTVNQPGDAYEQEADRIADAVAATPDHDTPQGAAISGQVQRNTGMPTGPMVVQREISAGAVNKPSAIGKAIGDAVRGTRGNGQPIPSATRRPMEEKLGAEFGGVRIHTDSKANQLAQSLGANALTTGGDIYFNQFKYDPGSREGNRLLAHELIHVVQQGEWASEQVQFDLMQTLPTAIGWFEIDMVTRAAPRPGMDGHIRFFPDPSGPYSAQIGLIQIANVTDVGGRTTPVPGTPIDWTNVGTGAEGGRQELMTTGAGGAPPGWFVDAQTATHPRTTSVGPNYIELWGIAPPRNAFGWLRSPTDTGPASLYDYPWFSFDTDFEFETVAKATDTQTVYGSLEWGFGIRSAVVQNEYVVAFDAESATFNEALERFRGYYTHEPIVLYFDTNSDAPMTDEAAKISGVLDYLSRYPDVQVRIDGWADERGDVALNNDLSQRRASNVQMIAVALGIDPTRIEYATGRGETTGFAAGSNQGTWRANRRVVMSFVRTASTPIVMP